MQAIKITLTLTGNNRNKYQIFWGKFITGFNLDQHCAKSLIGEYAKSFKYKEPVSQGEYTFNMDSWKYFYLCGVSGKHSENLHLPLRYKQGNKFSYASPNGEMIFDIENAELIEITPLPANYMAKDSYFTTCRNWQFAVQESKQHEINKL